MLLTRLLNVNTPVSRFVTSLGHILFGDDKRAFEKMFFGSNVVRFGPTFKFLADFFISKIQHVRIIPQLPSTANFCNIENESVNV